MTKKNTLLFLFLLTGLTSLAQGTGEIAIYSNDGYSFHVILNGVIQNSKAESNVKVQGLSNPYYGCKVIAGDNSFSLDKNIIVKQDTLVTYRIVNKKGSFKLRFFSETPLKSAPVDQSQTIVVYHTEEIAPDPIEEVNTTVTSTTTTTTKESTNTSGNGGGSVNISMNVNENNGGMNSTTEVTEVHTETSVQEINNGSVGMNSGMNTLEENVSISISANENGMNVNMSVTGEGTEGMNSNTSVHGTGMQGHSTFEETSTTTNSQTTNGSTFTESTTTVTTTTTTTSSSSGMGSTINVNEEVNTTETSSDNWLDSYCLMNESEFEELKSQIEDEAFSDDQLRIVKQVAKNKCLSVDQIEEVTLLFAHSDDQLTVLKTAYDSCYEKDNYYQLLEILTFSDDKEELEKFLDEQ